MGAQYPYDLLADSVEGRRKEARSAAAPVDSRRTERSTRLCLRGVPHITLKSIANNAEIDVIWEEIQPKVQGALDRPLVALRGHKTPFRVKMGGREGKDVQFSTH